MKTFTYIAWIIWIIWVFLGFKDSFPEYSDYLLYSGFICIWLVIWLIISLFDKSIQVKPYELTIGRIFVFSFYAFIALLLLILLLRQPQYFESILWGIWVFILFTFNSLLPIISGQTTLTISERKILANKYEQDKNYSEAIHHYNKILHSFDSDDQRAGIAKAKIDDLKKKQLI